MSLKKIIERVRNTKSQQNIYDALLLVDKTLSRFIMENYNSCMEFTLISWRELVNILIERTYECVGEIAHSVEEYARNEHSIYM